ncbi:MAG TPA: hypothetical protein VIA98_11275 [Allosphingosinicella sp.]|jgi:hypothetical protein
MRNETHSLRSFEAAFGAARSAIRAAALGVMLALSGCAAYHTIPPAGYSAVEPRHQVMRVAFDMFGEPYPVSRDANDTTFPPQQRRSSNTAFSVRSHYRRLGRPYEPEAILDAWAAEIRASLSARPGGRVVFLIKGFNNSSGGLTDDYAATRDRIASLGGTDHLIFIEVLWDAFYRGRGTAPLPLAYFADSITSSLLAGTCGLRPLLGRLPEGTNVTLITHSRGGAIALAAFTKANIYAPRQCPVPPVPSQLGNVRAVAFAPALGDGIIRRDDNGDGRAELAADLFDQLDRLYVGFNPRDPATAKRYFGVSIGARRGGDTRLASDRAYLAEVEGQSAGRMQHVEFSHPSHPLQNYLRNEALTRCLLWAGQIIEERPADCGLAR